MATPEQNVSAAISDDSTSPAVVGEDAVPEDREELERLLQAEMEEGKHDEKEASGVEVATAAIEGRECGPVGCSEGKIVPLFCDSYFSSTGTGPSPQPSQGLELRSQVQGAATGQIVGWRISGTGLPVTGGFEAKA